jgi:UDP-N-acetylglucosamine 2-epimerase
MHATSAIGKHLAVRIAVIADSSGRDRAEELAEALASAGHGAELLEAVGLASALVAFEAKLTADRPDAVALVGEGDEVLAGAIVAAKLEIPALRVGGAEAGYGRILDILAERTLDPSADQAARQIAGAS